MDPVGGRLSLWWPQDLLCFLQMMRFQLIWIREELLPQLEEFKYLGSLFTSEGEKEQEIDRLIRADSRVRILV